MYVYRESAWVRGGQCGLQSREGWCGGWSGLDRPNIDLQYLEEGVGPSDSLSPLPVVPSRRPPLLAYLDVLVVRFIMAGIRVRGAPPAASFSFHGLFCLYDTSLTLEICSFTPTPPTHPPTPPPHLSLP